MDCQYRAQYRADDLLEKAKKALGWEEIISLLDRHALSPGGAALCRALSLSADVSVVRRRLAELSEMIHLCEKRGLPLSPFPDLGPALERTTRGGSLTGPELRDLSALLQQVTEVKKWISKERDSPLLREVISLLDPLSPLKRMIDSAVDPEGRIRESASPELARLLTIVRERRRVIEEKMGALLTSPRYALLLQEPYFTQRGERYVLPVKVEHRSRIAGIVHDISDSGATLFIEPHEVIELNNEMKVAELEAEREVARLLFHLSREVAAHAGLLSRNCEILASLDLLQAKMRLGEILRARVIKISETGCVRLIGIRHPLLILTHREVVPNNILVERDVDVLVISGPNAGGKTVTLKTLGISALMMMGGLPLPCEEGSEMPLFPGVYADIGDDQDLSRDLSSFSAQIKTLSGIVACAPPGALVLLDELVTSTDPSEGAALAHAVLLRMREKGFKVVLTTHYHSVKALAHSHAGFANASMEFDRETLSPTYRLLFGLPGRSSAFEIARRLGLEEGVVTHAATLIGEREREIDRLLAELEGKKGRIEEELKKAEALRARTETLEREWREKAERIREAEREMKKTLKKRLAQELSVARAEIRTILEEVRAERKRERLLAAQSRLDQVEAGGALQTREASSAEKLKAGERVEIIPLGIEGILLEDPEKKKRVRVGIGGREVLADLSSLAKGEGGSPPGHQAPFSRDMSSPVGGPSGAESPESLDLRGRGVDDALSELERFLDRATCSGLRRVILIHGHGTGRLKKGVREHLTTSPYVKSFCPGELSQGGDGVTVVDLME